ncbi:MAG: lipolytic protein family [Planctomycetota bacterium]|nr:lipolytic protein family [Planctomycetota bacterium]
MTGDASVNTSPPPRVPASRRPRLRVIVLGNLLVLAGLLVVAELVARIVVWTWVIPTTFETKPFQGFGQTDPMVWWKLRPNLDARMGGVRLRTNRLGFRDERQEVPPDSLKILCLGDSSTFGWGVDASRMYTAVAERGLASRSGRGAAVVSAGVPGYTSFQSLQQFREQIARLKPDWVVVMASNNECRARNLGDRERGRLLARKQALHRWLGFSRLWLLISRAPEALSRTWDLDPKPGRVADTPDEYAQNIRDLVAEARRANLRVLVMNMPLRLRSAPVWKQFERPTPEVADLLRRAEDASKAEAPVEKQAALLEQAARLQPNQFEAHWRMGNLELRRGRTAEADRCFALARDGDLHPETSKPSYNRVLSAVCRDLDVPFIDLDSLFRESGLDESALFLDHCHPSPTGHRLIGRELARRLNELRPGP